MISYANPYYTCAHCGATILPTNREFCCAAAKETAMSIKALVMDALNEARAARAQAKKDAETGGPMTTLLKRKYVVARKQHICAAPHRDDCKRVIKPGDTYLTLAQVDGYGDFHAGALCIVCAKPLNLAEIAKRVEAESSEEETPNDQA